MIPTIEVKAVCPQCGVALNHFANVDYCPNHGQPGRRHEGASCPAGCDPKLSVRLAHGWHCNNCAADWLA
jgi:hypothetical protein